jgi:peptide/nickel transport system ATP-binding protein
MSALLAITDLHCSSRTTSRLRLRGPANPVLQGIGFSIEEGATLGLLGESGTGKSTLARCIAGIQEPDQGEIYFRGVNIFPETKNRSMFPVDIQMLFQASSASLDPTMTVGGCLNEALAAQRWSRSTKVQTIGQVITSVGLPATFLDRLPHQLSGGQRQRVALARALAVQPGLLILDEPTSALDMVTQQQILTLLKRLQTGTPFAMVFITHDIHTAVAFCDRIAVLHGGRIVEEGESEAIFTHPAHPHTQQLIRASTISS